MAAQHRGSGDFRALIHSAGRPVIDLAVVGVCGGFLEGEPLSKSGYDQIASEYYSERHVTSRNFDAATKLALENDPFIIPEGLVLELGSGKGRANEFLGIEPSRIVQLDSSLPMLELAARESCLLRVWADACSIPLVSRQFAGVVGFLVDPFLGLDCLAEAHRMLKDGGQLLLTTPTEQWGRALRGQLHIDLMTTRFNRVQGDGAVVLPSLLYTKERIKQMLEHSGFREVRITDECLPSGLSDVSQDIVAPSCELAVDLHALPIIHTIRAQR
jgi:SAM-dependent methyltransferase